jgi:hypothetical protein
MTTSRITNAKQTQRNKFPTGNSIGNRFQKGQSGNPSGRPRLTKLTDALRQQLAETNPNAPEETVAEEIARALISEAKIGNVQAIREIGDRTEGKARQAIDLDVQVNDWRTEAQKYGLSERDILAEARILIEQSDFDSGDE